MLTDDAGLAIGAERDNHRAAEEFSACCVGTGERVEWARSKRILARKVDTQRSVGCMQASRDELGGGVETSASRQPDTSRSRRDCGLSLLYYFEGCSVCVACLVLYDIII